MLIRLEQIRSYYLFKELMASAKKRDNYTCQICGQVGGRLNTDHFPKTFAQIILDNKITTFEMAFLCEELWDINNLRTLCYECHILTPSFLNKPKGAIFYKKRLKEMNAN